jgi:abnormal spindle-like microcephaly-associated protein
MVRKYCEDANGAATKIQASYRMHLQSVQFKKDMSNVVKSQSMVRTWLVKQSLMKQSQAVSVIQRNWRSYICVKKEKIERSAISIQSSYRGYLARCSRESKMEKIVIIQKYFRGWKCKKRYQKYMKMKKAMKDFATAAKLFTVKSAAAIKIQSNFRTFVCKRKLQNLEREHRACTKIQAHWRGYLEGKRYGNILEARNVLRKWVPFIRDRTHFLQMKKSAVLIQSAYKKHYQRRVEGAQIIQNYSRSLIAKRQLRDSRNSILKIQSLYRSYKVRCSSSKELKSIRIRLSDATVRVKANPKLSIGYQMSTALRGLLKARSVQSSISFCKVVEFSTKYSPVCCMMLCDSQNAITTLLRFIRSCNRSEPHIDFLKRVLTTLNNVMVWDQCLPAGKSPMTEKLGNVPDIFTALSEVLQMFRGNQGVFLPAAQVLQALVSKKETAQMQSAEFDGMRRKIEGISQIMKQKLRLEKKYIDHMENKKGSDVSARESAKKVLQITSDLQSLCNILNCFDGAKVECVSINPQSARNTIVRKAFRETSNLR